MARSRDILLLLPERWFGSFGLRLVGDDESIDAVMSTVNDLLDGSGQGPRDADVLHILDAIALWWIVCSAPVGLVAIAIPSPAGSSALLVVFSAMVALALVRSIQSSILRRRIRRGLPGRRPGDARNFFVFLGCAFLAVSLVSLALLS